MPRKALILCAAAWLTGPASAQTLDESPAESDNAAVAAPMTETPAAAAQTLDESPAESDDAAVAAPMMETPASRTPTLDENPAESDDATVAAPMMETPASRTTTLDESPAESDDAAVAAPVRETRTTGATATEGAGPSAPPDSGPDPGPPAMTDDGAAQVPAAAESRALTLREAAHERMVRLLDEERYTEAVEAARQVVKLTEEMFGPTSSKLAAPLNNLATSMMLNGALLDAEKTYQRSIAITKASDGLLSPKLINAYIGLGATYNRAGLYEKAEEALSTALHLNNVNEGFSNLDQMKIRDGLTETYIGLEKMEDANFHQEIQLEILQRRLGVDNPETTTGMYKLARWYERSLQIEEARLMYQQAQQLIRRSYGRDSIEMVAALEGLAGAYERQGLAAESASNLKKALKIVEKQPEIDRVKQADLLVRLGDLYGSTARYDTASAYYERGWQALSLDDTYTEQRAALFDEPVRITGLDWGSLRYASGDSTNWKLLRDGYVLVRYDVNAKGRVDDVVIIESEPPGLMDERVETALERSYFRPRFADGVAVAADDLLYRHDFRYLPTDSGKSEKAGKPLEPPVNDDRGERLEYPDGDNG
jgi:tetratricopeptide (TPR) repeat protein